jgi:hypothetical protein
MIMIIHSFIHFADRLVVVVVVMMMMMMMMMPITLRGIRPLEQ